jgi:oligopeptide/dipeptide ABC transporter ATP-binding protein
MGEVERDVTTGALLSVDDLSVTFPTEDGDVHAVRGVSFDVAPGETVGIVGESGSGKSVSTHALLQLVPGARVGGEARFHGVDLLTLPADEIRRIRGAQIAMVFQDPMSSLHPQFSVGWQIVEAIRAHGESGRQPAKRQAVELLDEVGIPDPASRVDDYPHQFSGGMRQRVMLAMALALHPQLLIADEPTTALDVTVQAQLLDLLARLQREHGTAVVLVTHDLGVIAQVADRVLTMYAGRIVEEATVGEAFAAPHHPYTRGLLSCIPGGTTRGTPLVPIRGQPPSMLGEPSGCAFAPRCPHVEERCRVALPPVLEITATHRSECILPVVPVIAREAVGGERSQAATGPDQDGDTGDELLRITGLVKHFPGRRQRLFGTPPVIRAVDGVDVAVRKGETLGLVGESGSGKSTLARLAAGLLAPTAGTVEIDGVDLAGLGRAQLQALRRDVQVVFQDPYGSLNPRRRVGSIIADPLVIHGAPKATVRDRVLELMELVGLNPEHHNRFPAAFSGGQRQRIGVARALALQPRLLICDEPVSALDVSVQAQIINLLQRLQGELDLTYLIVSHDLGVIEHVADRVAVMYLGRIVEVAATDELFAAPRHPYTRVLLDAVPVAEPAERRRIELVAGDVPSAIAPPSGCRFHTRCRYAQPDCAVEDPALVVRAGDTPDHRTACLHPLPGLGAEQSVRPTGLGGAQQAGIGR